MVWKRKYAICIMFRADSDSGHNKGVHQELRGVASAGGKTNQSAGDQGPWALRAHGPQGPMSGPQGPQRPMGPQGSMGAKGPGPKGPMHEF